MHLPFLFFDGYLILLEIFLIPFGGFVGQLLIVHIQVAIFIFDGIVFVCVQQPIFFHLVDHFLVAFQLSMCFIHLHIGFLHLLLEIEFLIHHVYFQLLHILLQLLHVLVHFFFAACQRFFEILFPLGIIEGFVYLHFGFL